MRSRFLGICVLLFFIVTLLFSSSAPGLARTHPPKIHPVIFVHGAVGSGGQFESQAMRFASNGYPANYVDVVDYDSLFITNSMNDVYTKIDKKIAELKAKTGAEQVDMAGHSLGTMVMQNYLSTPARAANIAHYVNIDGMTADAPPGGVPTLALWAGMGKPDREIVGAVNVTLPNQTHVQSATSAEAFVEMFKFFTGKKPKTSWIVPQPPGQVRIAGRAVVFPLNTGTKDATVEMWEVNGRTGKRIKQKPAATCVLGSDGAWGPFKAKGGTSYEFTVLHKGWATHHLYYQPFIRSDYLVRLLVSPPGDIASYMETSRNHTNLAVVRYKEFWGDQGVNNDTLEVNGTNVVTAVLCPITKRVISLFMYDRHKDRVSDLSAPIPFFSQLPFLTGVDIYIPGAEPPSGKVSVVLTPRGGKGKTQVINAPNWASKGQLILVQFNDFYQDITTWQEHVRSLRK